MANAGGNRQNPAGMAPGMHPFWFWNGDLSADEIVWQIEQMSEQGMRGFYIHPRQGLRQPYLSQSFFDMVDLAVETAERLGLGVHLYDEYPYPSGVAGGEVVLGNPQFHATRLVQESFDVPGQFVRRELPRGHVLTCAAYPLSDGVVAWDRGVDLRQSVGPVLTCESYRQTGLTQYNRKRYFASEPTPTLEADLPPGEHRVYVAVQAVVARHKYWGHYVDLLNPEAVREFMACTHERYRQRYAQRFGRTIDSIFVDETEPGWSARIPAEFMAECGYDLLEFLPALQDDSHPRHLEVADDLQRLRYRLFCESFEEPVAAWCARHGLRYVGEKAVLRLSQLKYMDIPGCEPGHTKAGAEMDLLQPRTRGNARAVASAAYFYEKEGALCECYHSMGWSATLQDAKLVAEGLLLMGIRYLVPHGFFYTTHGLAKHDAPPSFFHQMPYWRLFHHLAERLERIAEHLEGTFIDAAVLVVDPSFGLPRAVELEAYEALLKLLMAEHLDFHVVDTDILESGRIDDGQVRIRDVSAHVVVLPPMRKVEEPLVRWLAEFEAAGGSVIRCRRDGPARWRRELRARTAPRLRIEAMPGSADQVQVVTRSDGRRRRWLILNTSDQEHELTLQSGSALREIPLEHSQPALLACTGGMVYRRGLQPFESAMVEEVASSDVGVESAAATPPPTVRARIGPVTAVTTLNANLLRMYDWRMTVRGADGRDGDSAVVRATPLANQLEQGGFRFAPKVVGGFGITPGYRLPQLELDYRFELQNHYDGPVELVVEPDSIRGEWTLRVNDGPDLRADDLAPTNAHVRGSLGVDVTTWMQPGDNTIALNVTTDRSDGGLRNALYLAGDFGVTLDPVCLAPRPATGGFETWEANGLPYYAGEIEYETSFPLEDAPPDGDVLLELDFGSGFHGAAEVSMNSGPWRPVLWSPRRLLVPASELRQGDNALGVRVSTTLIRAFEGEWFDVESHHQRKIGAVGDGR